MNLARCFNDAVEVYKQNFWHLVLAMLLFDVLSLVSLSVLIGPLAGGISLMTLNALRRADRRVDFGDFFGTFDKFLRLCGLFYLTFIPILLGFALCLAPGLLLAGIWALSFFLVVDRDRKVFASLGESTEIVLDSGLGNYVLLGLIQLALALVPESIPYVGVIVSWFVAPISWLIVASAYQQECERYVPPQKPLDAAGADAGKKPAVD